MKSHVVGAIVYSGLSSHGEEIFARIYLSGYMILISLPMHSSASLISGIDCTVWHLFCTFSLTIVFGRTKQCHMFSCIVGVYLVNNGHKTNAILNMFLFGCISNLLQQLSIIFNSGK